MEIGDSIAQFLGVLVSIVLYIFTRRQFIGAHKEKIMTANREVVRILVRRLVQENIMPSAEQLSRIVQSQAQEHRIRASDLLTEDKFVSNAYAKIFESDLIPSDKRKELLDCLNTSLEKMDKKPIKDGEEEVVFSRGLSRSRVLLLLNLFMALAFSVLGPLLALSVSVPEFLANPRDYTRVLAYTCGASFLILGFILLLYRAREQQQEEPQEANPLLRALRFERDAIQAIDRVARKQKILVQRGNPNSRYDLKVKYKGRQVLVELKYWRNRVRPVLVRREVERLRQAMIMHQASEAILVTPGTVLISPRDLEDERIKVLSLRAFLAYLSKK